MPRFPPPATSNRTCGLPASGSPTTFDQRHSRLSAADPLFDLPHQARRAALTFWHSGLVCAEVLVMFIGVVGPKGHAPSLTVPLDLVEGEALPSQRVVLSRLSAVLWPPPTSQPASVRISLLSLYRPLRSLWTNDQMRPLLFHRLLCQHPTLLTPEGS